MAHHVVVIGPEAAASCRRLGEYDDAQRYGTLGGPSPSRLPRNMAIVGYYAVTEEKGDARGAPPQTVTHAITMIQGEGLSAWSLIQWRPFIPDSFVPLIDRVYAVVMLSEHMPNGSVYCAWADHGPAIVGV